MTKIMFVDDDAMTGKGMAGNWFIQQEIRWKRLII